MLAAALYNSQAVHGSDPHQLSPAEFQRYGRHLTLPEVGLEGQLRLKAASVLLVGAGGLGSPVALYLAAAGIGRVGLVEFDRVEASNLQRQVLYGSADVGQPKLERAVQRIADINPEVQVDAHAARFDVDNARALVSGYDLVIDGTDNFPTRYLVNDACVLAGKPNVYGSIFRFEGQVSLFWAERGPCYRCLFPEPPEPGSVPNCAEGGVLGVLPGTVGTLQATEAIKWFLHRGESLLGRLLLFDAMQMRFRELKLRKDPDCPACGPHPTIEPLRRCGERCPTPQPETNDMTVEQLKALQDERPASLVVVDVRTDQEWAINRLPDAKHIPLDQLVARVSELDPKDEIVVYCHHGGRSAQAVGYLQSQGYERTHNLDGGIDAWAARVDSSMPRY